MKTEVHIPQWRPKNRQPEQEVQEQCRHEQAGWKGIVPTGEERKDEAAAIKQGAQIHGWPGVQNWNSGAKMSTKRTGGHPGRATLGQEGAGAAQTRREASITSHHIRHRRMAIPTSKGSQRICRPYGDSPGRNSRKGARCHTRRPARQRTQNGQGTNNLPLLQIRKEEAESNETGDEIDRVSDIVTNTKELDNYRSNATYRTTKIPPKVSVYPTLNRRSEGRRSKRK